MFTHFKAQPTSFPVFFKMNVILRQCVMEACIIPYTIEPPINTAGTKDEGPTD